MSILKGNVLYGQSGGPTSIINSSALGLIIACIKNENIDEIYCMHNGLEGLLKEDLIKIDENKDYSSLMLTPGAYFGSNRYKIKDYQEDESEYIKILKIIKKYNIRYLFYNGGNDSMHTLNKIGEYVNLKGYELKVFGIPKTIDNDLYNNYFSLGFISASNFVKNSILEIALDDLSYSKGRVNIIETMGRNTGWLACSSLLVEKYGIDIDILEIPEISFDEEEFLSKVKNIYEKKHHCLVVVSEGIKNKDNKLVYKANLKKDEFNHHSLGGVSHYLANLVESILGYKVRSFELSLLQRASALTLSKLEVNLAMDLSEYLLDQAVNTDENFKVGCIKYFNSYCDHDFYFDLEDLEKVANYERKMDQSFFNDDHSINKDKVKYYFDTLKSEVFYPFNDEGFIDILKK